MLNIFNNFLDANRREINRLSAIVVKINSFDGKIKKLTDKQLKEKTADFKKRLTKGESLVDLLPESFAVVKEAFRRTLKIDLFDVQMMAAIAVHLGKIAEQKTGEGKTFSVVPAIYLNALIERGVHVVTVNDYLARRDCGWVAPVFEMLGLRCAAIIHEEAFIFNPRHKAEGIDDPRLKHLHPVSRKEAYDADITYGTNNEFGFDYLRDNMAHTLADQKQRGHYFAIVDEVDSILIDEARTPLIISAPAQEPTDKYVRFGKVIDQLSAATDFVVDEKLRTAHLTEHGTIKIEKILGVENLYENDFSTLHHLEEALKARTLFSKDKDYVVRDDEVIIVDEFTGRLMPGRRYSEGLHQAIEAKEGVTIQQESKTMATVSFQNYFRMYEKLAGMTGTAATEAEEFHKIYKLDVVIVPTNMPTQRKDHPDSIFKTVSAKYTAVAEEIGKIHESGQPVLVGTTSIEKNEFLSELLKRKKISHALLNAKNHQREAEIIADAGQKGSVTVATNLAGRGVDIKLAKGVPDLGGLYVIGTERHESRRIDNQLRGRSGRQGDPGASKFFVSLEDDLMRIFGGEQVAKVMNFLKVPEDTPIENPLVSRALEGAQKKVEGHNFDMRKHTVEYDDVMNQQRKIIYGVRQQILVAASTSNVASANAAGAAANVGSSSVIPAKVEDPRTGAGIHGSPNGVGDDKNVGLKDDILEKVRKEVDQIVSVNALEEVNKEKIIEEFCAIIPFDENSQKGLVQQLGQFSSGEQIGEFLGKLAMDLYVQKEKQMGTEAARQIETFVYLQTMDELWIEHLDTVDDLRSGINLRAYAQRDPLVEYKREAFDLFDKLIQAIDSAVVHRIYRVSIPNQQPIMVQPVQEIHQEALDEDLLKEEVGQLISPLDRDLEKSDANVRVERDSSPVIAASSVIPAEAGTQLSHPELDSGSGNSNTRVTIERAGANPIVQEIRGDGATTRTHAKIGRNDPCWCGSGKKYKKCHYPN